MELKEKIAKALWEYRIKDVLKTFTWENMSESLKEPFYEQAEAILPIIEVEMEKLRKQIPTYFQEDAYEHELGR